MDFFTLLPESAVFWTLASLAALRVLIRIVNDSIAKSPDPKDDIKWGKIKNSLPWIILEQLLDVSVGIQLPRREGKPSQE